MTLFHTSPATITQIDKDGRFGEFLFFSPDVYVTTAGEHVTYALDVDDEELIDASSLFYHADAEKLQPIVSRLAARLGISEELAEDLISEKADVFDIDNIDADDAAEFSWSIQRITARCAKVLGFRGVAVSDETGTSYMIDMLNRASELKLIA